MEKGVGLRNKRKRGIEEARKRERVEDGKRRKEKRQLW